MATQKIFLNGEPYTIDVPEGRTLLGHTNSTAGTPGRLSGPRLVFADSSGKLVYRDYIVPLFSGVWSDKLEPVVIGNTASTDGTPRSYDDVRKDPAALSDLHSIVPVGVDGSPEAQKLADAKLAIANRTRMENGWVTLPSEALTSTNDLTREQADFVQGTLPKPAATGSSTRVTESPTQTDIGSRLKSAPADAAASRSEYNKGVPAGIADLSGVMNTNIHSSTQYNAHAGSYVAKEWVPVMTDATAAVNQHVQDYMTEQRKIIAANKDETSVKRAQANLDEAQARLDKTGGTYVLDLNSGSRRDATSMASGSRHTYGAAIDIGGFSASTNTAGSSNVYGANYSANAPPGSLDAFLYRKIPESIVAAGKKNGVDIMQISKDKEGRPDETHFQANLSPGRVSELKKEFDEHEKHYNDNREALIGSSGINKVLSDRGITTVPSSAATPSLGAGQAVPTSELMKGVIGNTDKAANTRIKVEELGKMDDQIKALSDRLKNSQNYQDKLIRNVVRSS